MTNVNDNLFAQQFRSNQSTVLNGIKKLCKVSTLKNKFPVLNWLPKYQASFLLCDAIAGFTVGLTTIPQAIAYGVVAGLQPQYGLYAAFMGCFTYIIFGTCKDVTIATTAIMALMVHDYAIITPDFAVFISFIAGCVILLLGLLNLGVLVRFISIPVITGFTMAAAFTIGSAQVNNLFGMKSPSNQFLPSSWQHFFTHVTSIRLNDSLLGVCSLIFLLVMKEMIALGMCNIMGSFVSSMPVTGSFTRTAINNASGVKTPLGGIVTGTMVLLALAFLTQTFYYIPKATLASVIIAAMISLVELDKIADVWKSKRIDLLPFMVTLLTCLFWSLEYGILCGVLINISFVLYRVARPQIYLDTIKICGYDICFVDVKQRLDFASAEYLKEKILKFMNENRHDISLIIVKGVEINSIDYTVAVNLLSLKEDLEVLSCDLICWNWNDSATNVICGLNSELRYMFKKEQSIEDVVNDYYLSLEKRNECSRPATLADIS
ncbi:sodium-independent sulfate anion transporter isoform X4 [Eurosta solidaginis]|uniref:sodium-independent sulfate anion transporter isoform X4 n=1 Tax=Eurosta solidaginis TaxID=178769 RepID=UPI0035305D1C